MEIPKLEYGEGVISPYKYDPEKLVYRKTIKTGAGQSVRKQVIGKTVREVKMKMKAIEKKLEAETTILKKISLQDEMEYWLTHVKKQKIKPQSYQRVYRDYINFVKDTPIGLKNYQKVTSKDIQDVLNNMVEERYARSTIQKVYNLFTSFYKYLYVSEDLKNPTLAVEMPSKHIVKVEAKTIQYFEGEDIKRFIQASKKKYKTGEYKYRYGLILSANIFLGLRISK